MSALATVVTAVWAMLPAYLPNNTAVVFGGGRPVDGGRTLGGARLLGDGKTWRGSAGGFLTGFLLAHVLNLVSVPFLPEFSLAATVSLPLGAVVGDIGASFLKRRTGRERGAAFPFVDQLDFVAGAWLFTALLDYGWFVDVFTPPVAVAAVVVTPIAHVTTNFLAYKLGLKDEPW